MLFRKRTWSELDSSVDSSESETSDRIEYYNGNLLLPIFSRKKAVLSPAQVTSLLCNIGQSDRTVSSALICHHQPLRVERHRSFIVDLEALKSKDDIKCDDAGSWKNNSSSKFSFVKDGDVWTQFTGRKGESSGDCVLKREYFVLRDGNENDFRKRIDTVKCKYTKLILYVLIYQFPMKGLCSTHHFGKLYRFCGEINNLFS